MTTGIIVRSILLTANQQFRVEKLSVITSANLVDWGGVEIDEDRAWDVFSGSSLCEDGIQLAAIVKVLRIRVRATIFRKTVLEKVAG